MTQEADFDRTWEYRFYDERGLITFDRYPEGVNGRMDSDEAAWHAAERFKAENGITVSKMERRSMAGDWMEMPVLTR